MEISIKDLEYELRLLFGASMLQKLTSKEVPGHLENYFKDSVYLHARNLYNFFGNVSRNDARVSQFTNANFDLSLYLKWKPALHTHVVHVKNERRLRLRENVINGEHLNQQTQKFSEDIRRLWEQWINSTVDPKLKDKLQKTLTKAYDHAENDYYELKQKLGRLP